MAEYRRVNAVDLDIRLLYYLHLFDSLTKLSKDLDAIWRYRTLENICAGEGNPPTIANVKALLLDEIGKSAVLNGAAACLA